MVKSFLRVSQGLCTSLFVILSVVAVLNTAEDDVANCDPTTSVCSVAPSDVMSDGISAGGSCGPVEDGKDVYNIAPEQEILPRQQIDPQVGFWSGQHIRNPLARAVYFKLKEDEQDKNNRHVYWYRVIVGRLPEDVQTKFIQFHQDEGTDEFLENCQEKSDQIFTQLFYLLSRPLLSMFMTQTSINGFLNRGSMFIFSKAQFQELLGFSPYYKGNALLDLGAGDGMVTKQMSGFFHTTYTTEMSGTMGRRLAALNFKVLGVNEWQSTGVQYDLVSCLNLLDRCDKPLSLLADIKASLKPMTGRVLVAVVIPFKPYVEFNSKTHEPTEYIHVKGSNFEEQVEHFVTIFQQSGFQVEKFSRLPYLCEGDLRHSYYVLNDAVFVLKPIES